MQTPTRMNNVVIDDYYHLTTMYENVNWMELTQLLSKKSLNPRAPSCTSTFTSSFSIAFLNVLTRENNASLSYIPCTLMSQIVPLLALKLVCTWYEESTHWGQSTTKEVYCQQVHQQWYIQMNTLIIKRPILFYLSK